jgi:hypothetical protein
MLQSTPKRQWLWRLFLWYDLKVIGPILYHLSVRWWIYVTLWPRPIRNLGPYVKRKRKRKRKRKSNDLR